MRVRGHYADACGERKRFMQHTRGAGERTGSACVQTDVTPSALHRSTLGSEGRVLSAFPRSYAIIIIRAYSPRRILKSSFGAVFLLKGIDVPNVDL